MSLRARKRRSSRRVGIRRFSSRFDGRGSHRERSTSFAAARSDRGFDPTGRVVALPAAAAETGASAARIAANARRSAARVSCSARPR
jgi:hypothetical protein